MTNLTNNKKLGGYQSLIVYQQAVIIYDLTVIFCNRYIDKSSRTRDQMVQAARSGKQNIVEGSLANSFESNLKLTSVSRASYGELLEDYKDFLRQRNLPLWEKNNPHVMQIRQIRLPIRPSPNLSNLTNWSNWTNSEESFANLLVTLINKQTYLLDRLLKAVEEKFVKEGGFRENLLKKRLEYRSRQTRL